jgi:predicted CoA-substrate-specific enzyme activase
MAGRLKSLGLCLGASTVSLVQLEEAPDGNGKSVPRILHHSSHPHEGDPKRCLIEAFAGLDIDSFDRIAATGRKFRQIVNLTSIPEPEALEWAYAFVKPPGVDCPAVVSAGGETFMAYLLDRAGRIRNVVTGNKCASGTGEFFLQQLRRMDVSLQEAARWAALEEPYHLSGRCSVFCKSDCTHATNKGIPKAQVTAGLCRMMADKILELLRKVNRQNVMIVGGTAQNRMMIEYLRREIPGLIVPETASCFEALGAALWGLSHETAPFPGRSGLIVAKTASFGNLPRLAASDGQVMFKTMARGTLRSGDDCILGLDVGSTTTKAVLLRRSDKALLYSEYLRTNGDPVGASRRCYRSLLEQVRGALDPAAIRIAGLGVCGSGRQIAGLHALTDGVINEIVAHAAAAVHFDPHVDTLFEIGGQDAKYTHIVGGVPADYAMNEACSAGTGSFLEESAQETLGLPMDRIAGAALRGACPPNFNDQCAAFIASDIKTAIQEGVSRDEIAAGLVYSICMNYANRVKGNRPVGQKIFMQGGVCYNRAVPLAMGALIGKPIVVPPEPGLMGAYGVALEIDKRLAAGIMAEQAFDLEALARREVAYGRPFVCRGGKEKCDRRCPIAVIRVEGKPYPFGGACSRYDNLRRDAHPDTGGLDGVRIRRRLVLGVDGQARGVTADTPDRAGKLQGAGCRSGRVGLTRSFLVNTYYPLYAGFFEALGYEVVLPERPDPRGIDQCGAAFCYPAELAHGFIHSLLESPDPVDFLFLPHFKAVHNEDGAGSSQSQVCPLVQGETFYLRAAFSGGIDRLNRGGTRLLTPLLDLSGGIETAEGPLVEAALQMGVGRRIAREAFAFALKRQLDCFARMKEAGRRMLSELEADPERFGVALFSRPYSGFAEEAHMGIPGKFSSRGIPVIPIDFLALDQERSKRHMYWGVGKLITKAARFVERHPQLFGVYITNFSCGPDSFLVGYFRDIMGEKPSLTLELDSHTADTGIETRVEAFLDIVRAYRHLPARRPAPPQKAFSPARTLLDNGGCRVVTSSGETLLLTDPRVTVLIPSMGRLGSEALAAVLKGCGLTALAHRENDEKILKLGRANTTCKECLPLILTVGTLLDYVANGRRPGEIVVYFMATGSGPCRFGQYAIYLEDLIRRFAIPDVALLSLSSDNSYAGMDRQFERHAWWAVVVSDVMEDIRSMLLADGADPGASLGLFEAEWQKVLLALQTGRFGALTAQLAQCAAVLKGMPLKRPPGEVPVITLSGEIFVRRDALSRQYLTERLAERGFAARCAPVAEWIHYCNDLVARWVNQDPVTVLGRVKLALRNAVQVHDEKGIKALLAGSGLLKAEPVDIREIFGHAGPYISPELRGEAVLTVGGALGEIAVHSCGVIAIGPFGCMPNRIAEAILGEVMTAERRLAAAPRDRRLREALAGQGALPFLAIESDGSPFPQLISAKLETFLLRAGRFHRRMRGAAGKDPRRAAQEK